MKICTKCLTLKPLNEFGKQAANNDRLRYKCNECVKIASAIYNAANADKIKENSKIYGEKNREKVKIKNSNYYAANREKCRTNNLVYRAANLDKIKHSTVAYRAANIEKSKATKAAWKAANPEKYKARRAAYHLANKYKCRASAAAWRAANPEKVAAWLKANPDVARMHSQNRRARKRENGGKLSKDIARRLFILQKGRCPCCALPLGDNYHLDHIMPLALGGSNSDENMQLLRAICNLQKSAKHPLIFMQSKGFLL